MESENKDKPVPMTFAGGPTYMIPHLKNTLKKELFSCKWIIMKNDLSSTSTPTTNSSGKSCKRQGIISELYWIFLRDIRYGFYQVDAIYNSQVFLLIFWVKNKVQQLIIQFVDISADWHSMKPKNTANPSAS